MSEKEYIERGALIERVSKLVFCDAYDGIFMTRLISEFPAADVEPVVRGEWVAEETPDSDYESFGMFAMIPRMQCSICGEKQRMGRTKRCPHCGAHMDGVD